MLYMKNKVDHWSHKKSERDVQKVIEYFGICTSELLILPFFLFSGDKFVVDKGLCHKAIYLI